MAEPIKLSIIVPAYREEARLGPTLGRIREYVEALGEPTEIIVIDDGSTDRTSEVAHEKLIGFPHCKVLRNEPNAGKGRSVQRGMLASSGEYALFTDADLSTPITEWDKLHAAHQAGADIAIGSRALAESDIAVHQPFLREMGGRGFNLFIRLFVMGGIRDTQCGFKSFRREVIKPVFGRQQIKGWGFDVEVLYIARRLGYNIAEVPVHWENDEATKLNALSDGIRMTKEALAARRTHKHLTPADRGVMIDLIER
ncbi:MAG: glycosyltransferase family 2 protein [Thermoguttaceae bacterium]|nr:glycosyltransferase family 2 protein [Thermoguttaceae bacterium]